ncbi:MAG: hypothetical protein ACQETO_14155 [Pseudomonadota bacterium]
MAILVKNRILEDALGDSSPAMLPFRTTMDGELIVPADSVRSLLKALELHAPGCRKRLEQGNAVAIDGEIHADALLLPLTADSEVCFVPAIEGG